MDFFKTMANMKLVNMDEALPEVENLMGVMEDNLTSEAQVNEPEI